MVVERWLNDGWMVGLGDGWMVDHQGWGMPKSLIKLATGHCWWPGHLQWRGGLPRLHGLECGALAVYVRGLYWRRRRRKKLQKRIFGALIWRAKRCIATPLPLSFSFLVRCSVIRLRMIVSTVFGTLCNHTVMSLDVWHGDEFRYIKHVSNRWHNIWTS